MRAMVSVVPSVLFSTDVNYNLTLKMASAHWLSKRKSTITVVLRTPITQMVFFNQGMLLLGSHHFLNYMFIITSFSINSRNLLRR